MQKNTNNEHIIENIKLTICLLILIASTITYFLTRNNINMYEETTEETTENTTDITTEITTDVPLVSYADIKSGAYNNKNVKIEGIVTDIDNIDIISDINVRVWIKDGDRIIDDGIWCIDDESVGIDNYTYLSQNLKIGDNCIFSTSIYSDGSICSTRINNVKITPKNTTPDEIKQIYTLGCTNINGYELIRNPDNYRGIDLKLNGTVFQVVSEENKTVDFLLDIGGDNGILYISYDMPESSDRILEGDKVTIYGYYYKMKTYSSVLGTKQSVPAIDAKFLQ